MNHFIQLNHCKERETNLTIDYYCLKQIIILTELFCFFFGKVYVYSKVTSKAFDQSL